MRGVVALAHVTVGTPFSFVRVAFNAYTTHSIAQFHASGWLRQRCPAKRQSFPALPSDKIVYASFYPGDFPSTDGSINNLPLIRRSEILPGRRLYCRLTSFSQSLQTNLRITLDGTTNLSITLDGTLPGSESRTKTEATPLKKAWLRCISHSFFITGKGFGHRPYTLPVVSSSHFLLPTRSGAIS